MSNLTQEQRSQLATTGAGFAGGAPGDASGSPAAGGFGGGRGGFTAGSIVTNDGSTITIKLTDGSSKYVLYSASTTIAKSATGTSADLVAGETVRVSGSTNADGSITATQIQLGDLPGGVPGVGGPGATPTT